MVGGIENQNYELSQWLSKQIKVKTIANTRGRLLLPFFCFSVLLKLPFLMKKCDAVLLGDGILSVIGCYIRLWFKKPVICIVHGLDLTFGLKWYQTFWVGSFLKSMDAIIAVSNETAREGIKRGLIPGKISFIPNGVDPYRHLGDFSRQDLSKFISMNIANRKVLLTSGRLVKRKGVEWFITNVIPQLPNNIIYIISGNGPNKSNIVKSIKINNLEDRVKVLGFVKDQHRDLLLNTADIFIQPNIRIENDMEGFGISVLEAGTCRLPVVAANIEGLRDAIADGENGFLVESGNAKAFISKVVQLLTDDEYRNSIGRKSRKYVIQNYNWEKIASKYIKVLQEVVYRHRRDNQSRI